MVFYQHLSANVVHMTMNHAQSRSNAVYALTFKTHKCTFRVYTLPAVQHCMTRVYGPQTVARCAEANHVIIRVSVACQPCTQGCASLPCGSDTRRQCMQIARLKPAYLCDALDTRQGTSARFFVYMFAQAAKEALVALQLSFRSRYVLEQYTNGSVPGFPRAKDFQVRLT